MDHDTTITTIADFLRILRANPDWHQAVQAEIVGKELLSLPQALADFVAATAENFRLVNERVDRLEATLQQFMEITAENFRLVNERVDRLEATLQQFMETTAENFRLVNERVDRLEATLQQFMETTAENFRLVNERIDQLSERQERTEARLERMEARQERMEARQEQTEARLERMESRQERMEGRQERMESQIGNLIGEQYERRVARNIKGVAAMLGARNPKILQSVRTTTDDALQASLDLAEENGLITEEQSTAVSAADLICIAQNRTNRTPIYIVAELSTEIAPADVARARNRAHAIAAATATPALAAVIGQTINDTARAQADGDDVAIVIFE